MLVSRHAVHICQTIMGSLMGMFGFTGCICLALILPMAVFLALVVFGVVLVPLIVIILCAFLLAVVWTVVMAAAAVMLLPLKACPRRRRYPRDRLGECMWLPWRTFFSCVR